MATNSTPLAVQLAQVVAAFADWSLSRSLDGDESRRDLAWLSGVLWQAQKTGHIGTAIAIISKGPERP